jgi:hypothetical protein
MNPPTAKGWTPIQISIAIGWLDTSPGAPTTLSVTVDDSDEEARRRSPLPDHRLYLVHRVINVLMPDPPEPESQE